MLSKLEAEHVIQPLQQTSNKAAPSEPAPVINQLTENCLVDIEEQVNCQVTKDGDIKKFELKGAVFLTMTDPNKLNGAAFFAVSLQIRRIGNR